MIQNIVIGKPLVHPATLLSIDNDDWENNEKAQTLFTDVRFLPELLKQAGIVKSTSEVKRNKPQFMISLDNLDCLQVKWGKKYLYIIVGK